MRILVITIFVAGLIYLFWPGPSSIDNFPPPPGSYKSKQAGDTWQNPNIVGYYTNFHRDEITKFYQDFFDKRIFGLRIPAVRLNHPPEAAYQYIRDQQASTFLEEYAYPLRESIFVNGYEPAIVNRMQRFPLNFVQDHIYYEGEYYNSKATLRYYPSPIWARLLIYLLLWMVILMLIKLGRRWRVR